MKGVILKVLLCLLFALTDGHPKELKRGWKSKDPNYKHQSEDCAKIPFWMLQPDLSFYVSGGEDASFPIPWQALIKRPLDLEGIYCGATILDSKTLLSAAHCFLPVGRRSINTWIRVGFLEKYSGIQERVGAQLIWNTYPGFEYNDYDNDFVILKLNKPLELNDNVQPACLPPSNYLQENSTESICFTSGWGLLKEGGNLADKLQFVRVPTVTQTDCKDAYHPEHTITSSMICAGYPEGGKDACTNDSGGPLVCYNRNNGKAILVGVVSWGTGCARPNKFGVYGRVTHVLDWIKENME